MAGREIVTVEGVARPAASCIRCSEKMVEGHGSQCGYCTPGFVMSLFEGYYRGDIRKHDQLDDQLCGNLCRCTGYRPIRDAAIEAFRRSEHEERTAQDSFRRAAEEADAPSWARSNMNSPGRDSSGPTSLAGCCNCWSRFPEARLIAGATELGLDITKRFKKFPTLISVEAVPELKEIQSHRIRMAHRRRGHAHANRGKHGGRISRAGRHAARVRLAPDSQPRHDGRQPRHRLAHRRQRPVLLALDAKVVLVAQHVDE